MEETNECNSVKPIDFDYIFSHSDQNFYEIPYSFDEIEWKFGETYKIRVGNVYDPSKFWIVLFEKELNLFYKFMNDFYSFTSEQYRIPEEYIKKNLYCAVYSDGGFYRGVIVDIPKFNSIKTKVVVFLFDFGFPSVVTVDNLFYLHEKMFNLSRFAIRARLYGIEPFDTDTWTNTTCEKFKQFIQGKVLLCVLLEVDPKQRTVYIKVVDLDPLNKTIDLGEMLINEKMAKWTTRRSRSKKLNQGKLVSKVKYSFLFPSFQAIETGLMPSEVKTTEALKCGATSSITFKPYYSYKGVELRD